MHAAPEPPRGFLRLRQPLPLAVSLLLALIFIGAVTFAWQVFARNQRAQQRADSVRALAVVANQLDSQLRAYLGAARILRSEWQRDGSAGYAQFQADAATIQSAFPAFRALNWMDNDGVIRWVYPSRSNQAAQNYAIRNTPDAWTAFRRARDRGALAVSGVLRLQPGGRGIAVYLPIRRGAHAEGYINAVIEPEALMRQAYSRQFARHYSLSLSDGRYTVFASDTGLQNAAYAVQSTLKVGGQTWLLRLSPRNIRVAGADVAWTVIAIGAVLAVIMAWLCYWLLITLNERRGSQLQTYRAANFDRVTGLGNTFRLRAQLREKLPTASAAAPLVLVLIHLGRFPLINSIYGFARGDAVLRIVTKRLLALVDSVECLFRNGSNEFAVVMPLAESDSEEALAKRLMSVLSEAFEIHGMSLRLPCSMGMAVAPGHGTSADDLLANAESALVQAREDKASGHRVYSENLRTGTATKLRLESRLRKAVENGKLTLVYQPIVRVADRYLHGFEALVRWTDPEFGSVPPAAFIPVAEQSGLIEPLGRWVLEKACAQAAEWSREFGKPVQMSINLSPSQVLDLGLVDEVRRVLDQTGLPPECLVLEITESLAMQSLDVAVDLLNRLKQPGINIALDDFGTGYSSFNYLTRLPIYAIKLDREFIRNLGSDPRVTKITGMMIQLAQTLGLQVVGEGVETLQQYELLRDYDCDLVQGYLFSKPVPAEQARILLQESRIFPHPDSQAAPRRGMGEGVPIP